MLRLPAEAVHPLAEATEAAPLVVSVAAAEVVVTCLPNTDATLATVDLVRPSLKPGTVWIDATSGKSEDAAALAAELPWESRAIRVHGRECRQPRLVCYMADGAHLGFRYSGLTMEARPWADPVLEVRREAERAAPPEPPASSPAAFQPSPVMAPVGGGQASSCAGRPAAALHLARRRAQ